jgi:hypothetical protein
MLRKKLVTLTLFLVTIFFFISCAKKDDDSSSSTSSFAPPSWIQGAWVDNVSSSTKGGWKFSSSDMYIIAGGELIEIGYVAAGVLTEHLTSSESEFSFVTPATCGSGDTSTSGILTYVFTKETTSTMNQTGTDNLSCASVPDVTYTKDTSL